jgi:hypothetical protein
MVRGGRNRGNIPQKSRGFHGFLGMQIDAKRKGGGGQGWIRTSVRLRGQIYSLLPLTTRPPVHTGHFTEEIEGSDSPTPCREAPLWRSGACLSMPSLAQAHAKLQTGRIRWLKANANVHSGAVRAE